MTFIQPIILASEFVQHIIVIVLVGLVVTDCVVCYRDLQASHKGLFDAEEEKRFRTRKREHLELLAAILLSTLWLIAEYFADLSLALYHLLFHVPVVLAILWLLRRVTKSYDGALVALFYLLVAVAGAHIFLDVLRFILHMYISLDPILRATFKTAEAVVLYFLVMRYMLISQQR